MSEQAVKFGLNEGLHGVLSEPESYSRHTAPIIIILNSGLLHKIGPYRLSVDLARKLAEDGFRVLRFDISGIGDSRMRLTKAGEDFAVSDVKSAMDYLNERFENGRFVLVGLCSGSDNSHRTSLVDSRVIGSIHLDGYGYRNTAYYAHYYGRRLLSIKLLKNKIKSILSHEVKKAPLQVAGNAYERSFPPSNQAIKEFSTLFSRGMKMLYVYTGGVEEYYNHKGQLKNLFKKNPPKNALDEEFLASADHTYSRVNSRELVLKKMHAWLDKNFK